MEKQTDKELEDEIINFYLRRLDEIECLIGCVNNEVLINLHRNIIKQSLKGLGGRE